MDSTKPESLHPVPLVPINGLTKEEAATVPEEKSFDEMSFSEAIASAANEPSQKNSLIGGLLVAFGKGEPGAIKVVTNAIIEQQYNEENKFPVSDGRFKQIIELAYSAIQNGEI